MTNAVTINVPFNQLVVSPKNVRKDPGNVEALAASIRMQGVLQNLVVSVEDDGYHVHAGGRRRAAIELLVASGERPENWMVPVMVIPAEQATAASLSENVHRKQMHPAEELEGFKQMHDDGFSIEHIADVHKLSVNYVERRLRMCAAAPELFELFRADKITSSQLIGLCANDDHAVQVAVWNSVPSWDRSEQALRRAVLAKEVEAALDHRVKFLGGIDAYEAAGGEIRRDLFSADGNGVILTNPALLDQLVAERLEGLREQVVAEGWAWAQVLDKTDQLSEYRLGRLPKPTPNLPPEAVARLVALDADLERLSGEYESIMAAVDYDGRDDDDLTVEEDAAIQAIDEAQQLIQEEIREINHEHTRFSAESMATAGVLIYLDRHRGLVVDRGRVRPEDRQDAGSTLSDGQGVLGGRETKQVGRKAGDLPDKLRRSLLGYRNLAVQESAVGNVYAMKLLQACVAVQSIRDDYVVGDKRAPSNLAISGSEGTRTGFPIDDEEGKLRLEEFEQRCSAVVERYPVAPADLWDALIAAPEHELDSLIALHTAMSISLDTKHSGLTAKLLEALDFNMAGQFVPTVENYLGRVSKVSILRALTEAGKVGDAADAKALAAMKKGALAAEAQVRLAETGWVPELIRTVHLQEEQEEQEWLDTAANDDDDSTTQLAA